MAQPLSRQDQRHRFAFSALFDLPFKREPLDDLTLEPVFTAGSGRPVNMPDVSASPYAGQSFGRALEVNTPRQVQFMIQFEY